MKKYFSEVLFILGEDRKKLPFLFLIFLLASILDLIGIGLVGPYLSLLTGSAQMTAKLVPLFIQWGMPHTSEDILVVTGLALLMAFLIKTIANIWVNSRIVAFSQAQQVRLRSSLMAKYQALSYTEYIRRNSSEYIDMMQRVVSQFAQTVSVNMLRAISDGIVALVLFGLLAWTNGLALALLVLLLGSFVFGYDAIFKRRMLRYGQEASAASKGMVKVIHESIEGLKEIRILGCEKFFHDQMKDYSKRFSRSHEYSVVLTMAPRTLIEFALVVFIVLLVTTTLITGISNQQLLPTMGVFGIAALRLIPAVNIASISLVQLRYSRDSVSRLYTELYESAIFTSDKNTDVLPSPIASFQLNKLRLESVSFRYPNTPVDVISDVSLEINTGDSIGLIGPSGAGKTTLIDIFLGLLTPQKGTISCNDTPLENCLGVWRSQVAYLPQQIFIIDDTLRSNVALGVENREIDNDRVNASLAKARLDDFVAQLPQGIDTVLGERGVRLSGGQKQRVALARAFYFGKNVLIMDEATSALDHETESEIVDEIKRLKGQVTMIIIAHRLSTVRHCDRIYRLKNGSIVESGNANEILH